MSLKVLSIVMVVLIAGALAKKSVFADTYVVVADRTAMLALDGTVDSVAYLQESDGRGGLFEWNAASISSTLTGADIVSSAVNSGTDTITSASHRLFTGMAVITTTAVNGLATNTIYYVITVDADNFQLATSFANAVAGTKIDLTGTAAVTVKQHFDPLGGFYVTPTSDVTGASGAWARADRFVRRPSITDFGAATTNSAAANDEAFQAAINFNGDVYVPKGVYELSRKAERWGGLTLYGDGPGASVLYWKNANSHGIEIKLSQTLTDFADVQNLDFRTNDTAGTSVAIKLDGSAQLIERPAHLRGNGTRQMAHFDNINIYGLVDPYVSGFDGPSVAGWDGGIWANETINVNLSNIYFNGMYNGATQETDLLSSFGFKVTSSDAGKGSVFKVDNSQVYYAEKAVEFDTVEGVQVQNSVLVAVKYGVFGHVSGTKPGPHFSLVDSHINAQFRAVDIDEQQQIFITDNLIYQRPNIVSNGIGIALSNVKDGIVANNILVRNTTLTNANYEYRGIVLASGTENVQVYDNIGRDTTYVVEAQDGSTGNRVYRNDLRNVSPNGSLTRQLYTDNGTGNTFGSPFYSTANAAVVGAVYGVDTQLASISIPYVSSQQRFDVYANVRSSKGNIGVDGLTDIFVKKSAGTALVTFDHSLAELRISQKQALGDVSRWNLVGVVTVTSPGTLTLSLNVRPEGANANFTAGSAQFVLVERD